MSTFMRALHYDLVTLTFGLEDFNNVGFNVTIIQRVDETLRRQLITAYNVVQSFRMALQLFSVFVHFAMTQIAFSHSKRSSVLAKLLFNVIICCSGAATNCLAFYFATHLSLIISVGMLQLKVLIVKLKQLYSYLEKCNNNQTASFTSDRFNTFHTALISIFPYFSEYNTVYGRIFVVYLAVNTPVNIQFVSMLVFDRRRLTAIGALYMIAYTAIQTVCIFAIQYYFVRFSAHLHAPAGLLNQLQVKAMTRMGNVRVRLKVANTMVAFLTTRPYGITYDRFGLVEHKTIALNRMGNVRVRFQMANFVNAFVHLYGIAYDRFGLVTMRNFVLFLLLYFKVIMFPLSDLSQLLHYDIVTLFFGPAFFNISAVPVLIDLTEFNPYCEKILYNAVILLTGGVMVYLVFSIVTFISLMISVGLAQLNVLLIKLKQLHHYLKLNGDTLTSFQFTKFKASQLSVFPYFTEYNTVYGRLLVVFVIANTPTNIFFVCTLIFNNGQTTVIGALYMFVYSIVQVLCIFAVQYYFVQFSRNFHAPSYLLNRLQIRRMHRMGNLRMRFQMANFVNAFLSVHLYGITYDRFGLVTMKALVLFLLLYFKGIMV
ncbi:hypothetical protein TYRP_012069, partial [Tyrophagus putrescentiae]